ncbi:MAG: type I secretion system permease/ATPase [Alphaproteobacteria bacterium]
MAERARPHFAVQFVVRSCLRALVWLLLFSLGINLLILASPIYMMQVFDRVLASGRVETLILLTVIAGIAVFVMGIVETARGRFLIRVGNWLDHRLSGHVIASALTARLAGHAGSAQPLRDLATLRSTMASPSVNAVIDTPWVPAFIVIIWLMHPLLGLIALGAAIVLFAVALVNELVSRNALRRAGQFSIAATQSVESALRNAEVVQALGMLPALLGRYGDTNAKALTSQRQAGDRGAAMVGLSKSLRLFVQIVILGSGAWLVLQGQLTSGGMIAASILLGRALAPVEQSIGAWRQLVGARDAWQRLTRLLAEVPPQAKGMSLPVPQGELACQQMTFVPAGNENPILRDITFDLAAGEVLGIIGPTAAGKSSLCKVVTGAWKPTRGHARLDGADISSWHADELGAHLGYLPQDVELFAGTVSENIARLAQEPDAAAVVAAAKTAGVHDIILSLPKGYDTEVGEAGSFLSGGERQRVGLARAFYGRPKLIVLDEPNASLDSAGEEALVEAILAAKEWESTVLLVTHQPSILLSVDKLMVLQEGRIQAFGPRDEILNKLRQAPAPAQIPAGGVS